ncbi:nuclear transport factor 2 family protein [Croceicoccus sp. YJ47]|uniref:YybH family protein n=1 Tax=Croceicoccus sp. YJ47 TaxID=2798724 RepID=UPI001920CF2F|nr:nuclear transport factor 2 family protein [Croceicoccus sp. YJ47]QQN75270.1 nuclear transport factor 2 family protein [Croceicoccus sp. YJ47]
MTDFPDRMAAPAANDPEIAVLREKLEEYRTQYNLKAGERERTDVEHLYKRDPEFTAYDVAPPLEGYKGWDRYAIAWSQVLSKYSEIRFEFIDEPRIFRKGDVAWMSVATNWYGKSRAGDDFAKQFRLTLIWVRDDDTWRITHEHGSATRQYQLSGGETV